MTWLGKLLESLTRRRAVRFDARAAIQAEAQVLLAQKSRGGALWELREREQAPGLTPRERRRIQALRQAVLRLSPHGPKTDTATRMLYRDV